MRRRPRPGFTLVELAAAVAVTAAVAAMAAPMASRSRSSQRGAGSAANLHQIGIGTAMYGADNKGRIAGYSWQAGVTYLMPDGRTRRPNSDQEAAGWQNTAILMEGTGRVNGPTRIVELLSSLPNPRFSHLPLMAYLGVPFPTPLFADPNDANLLAWQADPLHYGPDSGVPNASEDTVARRQRWAYGSSYLPVVSAWNPDGLNAYTPLDHTPHMFWQNGSFRLYQGRNLAEVAFPSAKVHYFEEFDRGQQPAAWFGYDFAATEKLMFDGSVNNYLSGLATSANDVTTLTKGGFTQRYVAIDTFPAPIGDPAARHNPRFNWTLGGLQGVDYPVVLGPRR